MASLPDSAQIFEKRGLEIGCLTINDYAAVAQEAQTSLGSVIIAEEILRTGMTEQDVLAAIKAAFDHNNKALAIGLGQSTSYLLGEVGAELARLSAEGGHLLGDVFLDSAIRYTLAAQTGNHEIGLEPCAGTGDACCYTGFAKALLENAQDEEKALRAIALMLKVGTFFRAGKTTTGCNMEGLGATAAAVAAATAEVEGGTPEQCTKALSLALSPTIAVPCVPRISVPGLCAAHIGSGILTGVLSARLVLHTTMPVTVDADTMLALAAAVHPVSATHIAPVTVDYMRPFFKRNARVEEFVDFAVAENEAAHAAIMRERVRREVLHLAKHANPVSKPFGQAVVGGSSQAVGSPTNMGRIMRELISGDIRTVTIELYPELFSRRGRAVPGVLMGLVLGARTDNAEAYRTVLETICEQNITVTVLESSVPQQQAVTVKTADGSFHLDTRNRGGGRIHLVSAAPSLKTAMQAAQKLGIEVIE